MNGMACVICYGPVTVNKCKNKSYWLFYNMRNYDTMSEKQFPLYGDQAVHSNVHLITAGGKDEKGVEAENGERDTIITRVH